MEHSVDFQIFNRYQSKAVDYPTAMLVREIVPTPRCSFMHTGYYFAPLGPLWSTLFLFGEQALSLSKGLLLSAKEAWTFNAVAIRQSSKGFEANVYPYLFIRSWQSGRLPLTRYSGVPFARATLTDTHGFWSAFKWAVQYHLDWANFGQVKDVTSKITPRWRLWIAHGVVSALASKAWVAYFFLTRLHPSKEGFESKVYPNGNILQYLAVNSPERSAFALYSRQQSVLVVQRQRLTLLLIGVLALGKQEVVQKAALLKHMVHRRCLAASRQYPVPKGFTHYPSIAQSRALGTLK